MSSAKKFDLGMYDKGESKSVTFETPGVVPVPCNVHPKMEAFIVVHANPYAAVTDADGSYTITRVTAASDSSSCCFRAPPDPSEVTRMSACGATQLARALSA